MPLTKKELVAMGSAGGIALVSSPAYARELNAAREKMQTATMEAVNAATKSTDLYTLRAAYEELSRREQATGRTPVINAAKPQQQAAKVVTVEEAARQAYAKLSPTARRGIDFSTFLKSRQIRAERESAGTIIF
jgi:hypothetical protein